MEKHVEKMGKCCEHSFSGPQRLEGNNRYCEKRNVEKRKQHYAKCDIISFISIGYTYSRMAAVSSNFLGGQPFLRGIRKSQCIATGGEKVVTLVSIPIDGMYQIAQSSEVFSVEVEDKSGEVGNGRLVGFLIRRT